MVDQQTPSPWFADVLPSVLIWISISGVFGLLQVWMGVMKCRRRYPPPAPPTPWGQCMLFSLADGNLFIFSISTAGGVFAVVLTEIYRQQGGFHTLIGPGVTLIIISVFIVVFSAHEWTDAKSASASHARVDGGHHRNNRNQMPLVTGELEAALNQRDVIVSVRFAFVAFLCALITEVLR